MSPYCRVTRSEPGWSQGHTRSGEVERSKVADAASAPHPGWRLHPEAPGPSGYNQVPLCRKVRWACWPPSPAPPQRCSAPNKGGLCAAPPTPGTAPGPPDRLQGSAIPVWDSAEHKTQCLVPGDGPSTKLPESSGSAWRAELRDPPALNGGSPPSRGRGWLLERQFPGCWPLLSESLLWKLRG